MEAQLIDTPCEPRLSTARPRSAGTERPPLAARVARYLQAAGVEEAARRDLLTADCLEELTRQDHDRDASWAELIAAVDRCLTRELAPEARRILPQSPRGRVALGLGPSAPMTARADEAAPPRNICPMLPQDLSLWRPEPRRSAERLRRFQLSRTTQGLAACLCWVAVLIVP